MRHYQHGKGSADVRTNAIKRRCYYRRETSTASDRIHRVSQEDGQNHRLLFENAQIHVMHANRQRNCIIMGL